jgi:hypothetical protein
MSVNAASNRKADARLVQPGLLCRKDIAEGPALSECVVLKPAV